MVEAATNWSSLLSADEARQVRELLSRAAVVDGTEPVSEQAVHRLGGRSDTTHLLATSDGDIVGYAGVEPAHDGHPAMVEAAVDPKHRGAGIGRELVAQALQCGGRDARVWAHGDLPAARAVASRLGLAPARELLQLRRALGEPPLPEVPTSEGVTLRAYAGPSDDADLLRVNAAAFDWHPEQGSWTQREIDERVAESWFDPAGLFVAVDSDTGEMLGFHWTKVHPESGAEPAIGEVYVVAVAPTAQGRGLGRLLTVAGLRYLRDRGLGAVLLYTEADNEAALHTYYRLAFERYHVDVAYAGVAHTGDEG
ncbi:Mycothiol acetyltransferase [Rhodococcus sp. RD6.2]|uniref:mycothiol synthase n=1 Tax=Rhodococcus sp. RD6.2 TaxID=260936 RepID=UPI00063B2D50|nr:mycothiol synthase [Rhodococcus sp. RD6.2]CRK53479.1 Mycothiol acetyltransferase [Rhodococcus sp. RD6.2]